MSLGSLRCEKYEFGGNPTSKTRKNDKKKCKKAQKSVERRGCEGKVGCKMLACVSSRVRWFEACSEDVCAVLKVTMCECEPC